MPKKSSRKFPSRRKKTSSSNEIYFRIRQKIYLFIPIVILLLGIFVFKNSVNNEDKASIQTACRITDMSGNFKDGEKIAYFEGKQIGTPDSIPSYLSNKKNLSPVLGESSGERWIELDLSEQKLIAHDGDKIFLETPISSGLARSPTPTGEFHIWSKLKATKMEGGEGKDYYNLPNVPYVMFFGNSQVPGYKGFGLHGTYWHNDFGRPRSHGCVNLPTPIAEQLYYWVSPVLSEEKSMVRATSDNPGTRIVIHN